MGARAAKLSAVLLCWALCAGCVEEPDAAFPEVETVDTASTFALTSSRGGALVARVDGSDVVGPDVSLARFEEGRSRAIRGQARGRMVHVEASEGHVTGLLSGGPVELTVGRDDGTLVVKGLVGGRISAFRIDVAGAKGNLGGCSYELLRVSFAYEGRRSCGGPTERVSLRIPDALDRWSDDERAAVLAVLLDRG
jgi:hypothetical protein